MKRILFVCTGNTCRSPMAEAILRALSEKKGVAVTACSAGLYAEVGAPMSSLAVLALEEMGIPAHDHSARQLIREIAREADLILTMTASHLSQVLRALPEYAEKTHTLRAFAFGSGDRGENNDITDPYGGSIDVYRQCAREITQSIERALEKFE